MPLEVYTLQYEASMRVHEEVFRNPSKRAAADPCLRPRGSLDRQFAELG